MATITTNFICKPPIYLSTQYPNLIRSNFSTLTKNKNYNFPPIRLAGASHIHITKATAASGTKKKVKRDERVHRVHNIEEFDSALQSAKVKLVVVEYALSIEEIYPFLVELSRTCNDVEFLLVMGDESEKTKELCEHHLIPSTKSQEMFRFEAKSKEMFRCASRSRWREQIEGLGVRVAILFLLLLLVSPSSPFFFGRRFLSHGGGDL